MRIPSRQKGFTLIEVLLALVIIAIALTALLKASSSDVLSTERIKDKTISHWVGMQAVTMIQLGLITASSSREITEKTQLLGQTWYWRARLKPTAYKKVQEITITLSHNPQGPFNDSLTAYRWLP